MSMTIDEARRQCLERGASYFEPDRQGAGWVCPICNSGKGEKGTGITSKDNGRHFTCWAGCFSNADIIDIVGLEKNLTSFPDKLQATCEALGVSTEWRGSKGNQKSKASSPATGQQKQAKNPTHTHTHTYKTRTGLEMEEAPAVDYSLFFAVAADHIKETDYHRGLSLPTLERFKVGYVAEWKHPKVIDNPELAKKVPATPRLIIPTSKYSYVARRTDGGTDYAKQKVGQVSILNLEAIEKSPLPVYVVEGEIDALSIIEMGFEAVSIGGTSGVKPLLEYLKTHRPKAGLLLMLDNDDRGQAAQKKLTEGLDRLKVNYATATLDGEYKDANEALMADREGFGKNVASMAGEAAAIFAQLNYELREALYEESAANALPLFLEAIQNSRAGYVPTGFERLDKLMDGGLYPGLYSLGAVTSLGKTTFALQIVDNIAKQGGHVMVFSLEMSKNELIAKSISRLTFQICRAQGQNTRLAKTIRGIMDGSKYKLYTQAEKDLIEEALKEYRSYANRIFITEGIGNIGADQIRSSVEKFTRAMGEPPKMILVDYLQIMQPTEDRLSDKQIVDKAVLELKRLTRDYNVPLLAISSFNRGSYTSPVNLASFKESGAIEYSSDVLMGMQLYGMDKAEGESGKKEALKILERAREAGAKGEAQELQIKILKQRNGSKVDSSLLFWPMFNTYEEPGYCTGGKVEIEKAEDDWEDVSIQTGKPAENKLEQCSIF